MPYSGYPTPDVQSGDITFSCIPILVPSNPEFQQVFAAAIYGLYASMANTWFWREQGTMTPEQAAFAASQGLAYTQAYGECGGDMDCLDVADCLENSSDVLQALLNQLAANGFTQNPDSATDTPELLPNSQTADSMLPADYDCSNPAQDMAVARAIVQRLHKNIMDAFEFMELATNTSEAAAIVTGAMPLTKTAEAILDFVNWVQETFVEVYQAAYTDDAENDIACAIFCHLQDTCSLSLDELIGIYEELGSITLPDPTDFQAILDFFATTVLSIDTTGVAAFHSMVLQAFKFGGGFFEMGGWNDLEMVIETAATYRDLSYDDLCDCFSETPTAQWALYMNFAVSKFNTAQVGVLGEYVSGAGWRSVDPANPTHIQIYTNFGGSFVYKAVGARVQGRGFTGSASDAIRYAAWSNPGASGTEGGILSATGLSTNFNENMHEDARLNLANVFTGQSFKFNFQNAGVSAYPTNFCQYNQVVIWGLAGVGSTKPEGAKWMTALPATTAEIFGLLGV